MICRPCGTCVARTARRGCARSSLKAAGPTLTCPYVMDGAGEGNRTLMTSLEGWRSAIELRPRARREPLDGSPGRHRQRTGYGIPAPNREGSIQTMLRPTVARRADFARKWRNVGDQLA